MQCSACRGADACWKCHPHMPQKMISPDLLWQCLALQCSTCHGADPHWPQNAQMPWRYGDMRRILPGLPQRFPRVCLPSSLPNPAAPHLPPPAHCCAPPHCLAAHHTPPASDSLVRHCMLRLHVIRTQYQPQPILVFPCIHGGAEDSTLAENTW